MINEQDKSIYIKQTLNLYDNVMALKEIIDSHCINEKDIKHLKGRVKTINHNWDKHTQAKNITGTPLDKEVRKILKEIKSKLNLDSTNLITFEVEKNDVRFIAKAMDELDIHVKELNRILDSDIENLINLLDGLRIDVETDVASVKSRIERITEEYPNGLVKELAEDYINDCKCLQMKFNRILDGIEILDEVKKLF